MLPHALQFDLRPRRRLPWLKAALLAVVVALAFAEWWWLQPRQAEVARRRAEASQLTSQGGGAPVVAKPNSAPAEWQATANQDGKLFALTVEQRLLEIERCTDAKTVATRIGHDEASGSTTLELVAASADDVSSLVACLNTSAELQHRWRLAGVEALPPGSVPQGGQRVVLRRD